MKYKYFDDLPKRIRIRVVNIAPNDYEEWVKKPIPALKERSIIDLMNNEEDGYSQLMQYFKKVDGYFRV